jgi:hypothetical protein
VSVLVTSYNYGRFIREAIDSVLEQPYRNVEIVVCDDASQDDSCAIVEDCARRDPRVRLIRSADNRGMAASTNAAFAASSGAIICLLDADDVFCADKITRVVQRFAAEPRAGFLLHSMTVVNARGTPIQQIPLIPAFERGWIAERVIRRGGRLREMPTSALCIRREAAEKVFPIPEVPFRRSADGFVFTLLPLLTEVTAIDEALTRYRVHTTNDFGAVTRSRKSFTTEIGFIEAQITQVNDRLAVLAGRRDALNLDRHLGYALDQLVLSLHGRFERPRRHARTWPGLPHVVARRPLRRLAQGVVAHSAADRHAASYPQPRALAGLHARVPAVEDGRSETRNPANRQPAPPPLRSVRRGAMTTPLGRGFHATVTLDPVTRIVSKRIENGIAGGRAAAALTEFARLQRFSTALATMPFLRCPKPVDVDPPHGTVRMSHCPGVPLETLLLTGGPEVEADLEHIAVQIALGLQRYVVEFSEPYPDLTIANVLYESTQRTVTLVDLTPVPVPAYDAARTPLEVSLGFLIAVGIYETVRPANCWRRRYHRRVQALQAAVVRRVAEQHRLHSEVIKRVADERFRILRSFGGPARGLWYAAAGGAFRRRAERVIARAIRDAGRGRRDQE